MQVPHLAVQLRDGKVLWQKGAGSQVDGPVSVSVTHIHDQRYRLTVRNRGVCNGPAGWYSRSADHVFINAVGAGLDPMCEIEFADRHEPKQSFWSVGRLDAWDLLTPSDYHVPSAGIPEADQHHYLRGGEAMTWDVVPRGYIERIHGLFDGDGGLSKKCLAFLYSHRSRDSRWPQLKALRGLWTQRPNSRSDKPELYDMGHWMWRQRAREMCGNWQGYGNHRSSRDGGAWGNWRYDMIGCMVERALLDGDDEALRLAYLATINHLTRGRIWTDAEYLPDYPLLKYTNGVAKPYNAMPRYEQGSARVGDAYTNRLWTSHTWGFGPLAVALLIGDSYLMELCEQYGQMLLARRGTWARSGGIRDFWWYLRDLRAYYTLLDKPDFKARADEEMTHVLGKVDSTESWFMNFGYTPDGIDAWQDGGCIAEVMSHLSLGVGASPANLAIAQRILFWVCDNMVRIRDDGAGEYTEVVYKAFGMDGDRMPSSIDWSVNQARNSIYNLPLAAAAALDPGKYKHKWMVNASTFADHVWHSSVQTRQGSAWDGYAALGHPTLGGVPLKILSSVSMGARPLLLPD